VLNTIKPNDSKGVLEQQSTSRHVALLCHNPDSGPTIFLIAVCKQRSSNNHFVSLVCGLNLPGHEPTKILRRLQITCFANAH